MNAKSSNHTLNVTPNVTPNVVGICGLIGSGKDTLASCLIQELGYTKMSFADALKDVVSNVFGWNRQLLEGDTKESRDWRNQVDEWWSNRLGIEVTPRLALQLVGTNLFRNVLHRDIWVACLERRLYTMLAQGKKVVVSDCRFQNELDAIKQAGGITIKIHRGMMDLEVHTLAMHAAQGEKEAIELLENKGIHASEWNVMTCQVDYLLHNDDTISILCDKAKAILQNK